MKKLTVSETENSYNAAIDFAMDILPHSDALLFLEYWREGAWSEIAEEFPEFDLTTTYQCDAEGNLLK